MPETLRLSTATPTGEPHPDEPLLENSPRRRLGVPIALFLLTCLSTFWVGVSHWQPLIGLSEGYDGIDTRRMILANWPQGLLYMASVLAILLTHELGHFVAAVLYRIRATVPIFLPFPINPIGTLGAVIAMRGETADRRQIFDIGIAGPLAGLVIALPLCIIGVAQLDPHLPAAGGMAFECPLVMRWLIQATAEVPADMVDHIWLSQMNPFLAAAWVGLVVTGLNMMPVGQLDGGHISYALFGRRAHWLAEGVIVLAIALMVYRGLPHLAVMVLLMLVVGTQHPATSDDTVPLGPARTGLGLASLAIPVLCFPPNVFVLADLGL